MADPAPNQTKKHSRWKISLLLIVILLAAAFLYFLPTIKGYANVGSSYAAHVTCSCRHIGGRTLEDCEKDFEAGMELVSVSEDAEKKRVEASFPLFGHEVAEYRKGYGCIVLTEKEREAE